MVTAHYRKESKGKNDFSAKIKNKNMSFSKYNDNTLKNLIKSINQPCQISGC